MASLLQAPAPRHPAPAHRAPRPAPRPPLPHVFEQALATVRGADAGAILGEGIGRLLLTVVALVLAQSVLDWAIDLSRPARAALLAGDALLLTWLARRWLILPWRRRYGDAEAALAMQRKWPFLGTSVIAAVQLVRPDSLGSRLLIDQLIAHTGKRLATLPARDVVSTRRARRLTLAAIAGVLGLAGIAWLTAPLSQVLGQRLLLSALTLPTNTRVVAISQDLEGPRGGDFVLSARADGIIPAQGRVQVTYANGQSRTFPSPAKAAENGVFDVTITNVQQSFTYQFFLGDGHGRVHKAAVRPAPLLVKAEFVHDYPDYTGLPTTTSGPGPFTFFAGASVRISVQASTPLGKALVNLGDGDPLSLTVSSDDPRTASGVLLVPAKPLSSLSISLTDQGGLSSVGDTVYPVRVDLDSAPSIKVEQPTIAADTIVASGQLPISARVTDDFVVTAVHLVTETPLNGNSPPRIERRLIPSLPNGTGYNAQLATPENAPWADGTTVTWWLEAADNNNATGPGLARSERFQLSIVSPAVKRQELLDNINAVSNQVEDLAKRQKEARETLGEALRNAPPTP